MMKNNIILLIVLSMSLCMSGCSPSVLEDSLIFFSKETVGVELGTTQTPDTGDTKSAPLPTLTIGYKSRRVALVPTKLKEQRDKEKNYFIPFGNQRPQDTINQLKLLTGKKVYFETDDDNKLYITSADSLEKVEVGDLFLAADTTQYLSRVLYNPFIEIENVTDKGIVASLPTKETILQATTICKGGKIILTDALSVFGHFFFRFGRSKTPSEGSNTPAAPNLAVKTTKPTTKSTTVTTETSGDITVNANKKDNKTTVTTEIDGDSTTKIDSNTNTKNKDIDIGLQEFFSTGLAARSLAEGFRSKLSGELDNPPIPPCYERGTPEPEQAEESQSGKT